MVVSSSLSSTSHGGEGFGSSGVAARSLRGLSETLQGRGVPVPEGGGQGRGLRVPEQDQEIFDEVVHEETLHARGQFGHEGGLQPGEGHVDQGGAGGLAMSGELPRSLFFESVYTSRGGETMQRFLERLRENELQGFKWLFSREVVNILQIKPSNGTTHEVVLR